MRMQEFLETMDIQSKPDKIEKIEEQNIIRRVVKNDINISCSFTDYFHTLFFISMEQEIPCIIGNTSDLFKDEGEELKSYIVTTAEDNPIVNAEIIEKCLENKEKVVDLYKKWKKEYNKEALESIRTFLEK